MSTGFRVETGSGALSNGAAFAHVTQRIDGWSDFTVRYPVTARGAELHPLNDSSLDPGEEIQIVAQTGQVLMVGQVTEHRGHVEHGPTASWLEVRGRDGSVAMAREHRVLKHTGRLDQILESLLGNYFDSVEVPELAHEHIEDENELLQAEDDLSFVRRMARQVGRRFSVTFGESGERARIWEPSTDRESSVELVINLNGSNLDAVDFAWDVKRPGSLTAGNVSLRDKSSWEAAGEGPGEAGSFGAINSGWTSHFGRPSETAELFEQARRGAEREASWFVTLTCSTSFEKLGTVVFAGDVVVLSGVGSRYNGSWIVWQVEHRMDEVGHTLNLQLARDFWGGEESI